MSHKKNAQSIFTPKRETDQFKYNDKAKQASVFKFGTGHGETDNQS